MADQTIRVSAKGEFGQLRSELKGLQNDLKNVTGEVDRGARKGGIFDENQLRALELYKKRFTDTMSALDKQMEKQNDTIDRMHGSMESKSRSEREQIRGTIKERERELDVIRRQIMATEQLYKRRSSEAAGFGTRTTSAPRTTPSANDIPSSGGGGGGGGLLGGVLGKVAGAGKLALGMAGVGGIISLLTESYQKAYARDVGALNLGQRIRGSAGRSGSAVSMYDQSGAIGMSDRMGYTKQESWQFLDQYTRMAGSLGASGQKGLMKFGRSYGLSTSEVASSVGANRAIGGGSPTEFADAIAGSVESSGMTPRILEVMETNNTLLQQMNTTLKDGSSKQILAYQTTLDTIGLTKGMTQLTGAQGANVIGGLGGIFSPQQENWKWMGIRALQSYDKEKYGNMDLYDLEMSYEDGLMNPDNIPAMAKYVKSTMGEDSDNAKRVMQRWLTDGGFAATKREASDLWDATDGLSSFSEDQMAALRSGDKDSGANYDENRAGAAGQGFLDTEARFDAALEKFGTNIVNEVMALKEMATGGIETVNGWLEDNNSTLNGVLEFLQDNWATLATVAGVALVATAVGKVVTAIGLMSKLMGGGDGGGGSKSKGGMLAAGVAAAAVTTAIFALNDSSDIAGHDAAAKAAGLSQNPAFADRLIAGAAEGVGNGAEFVFGSDLNFNRENAYGVIAGGEDLLSNGKAAPSKWQQHYDTYLRMHNIKNPTAAQKKAASAYAYEQEAKDKQKESSYQKNNWTDPARWVGDALEKGADGLLGMGEAAVNGIKGTDTNRYVDYGGQSIPYKNSAEMSKLFENQSSDFFADYGQSDIGKMPKNIEDFTKTGKNNLTSFRDDSMLIFDEMGTDTRFYLKNVEGIHDEHMQLVVAEHRGFKTMMAALFAPMVSMFAQLLNPTSAVDFGNRSVVGRDVTQMSGANASMLNSKFGGKLQGTGQMFMQAGQKYGIDPAFLASIAMHETGNGTSNAINTKNNVGGMMGANGLMSFGSLQQGIDAMASNLKRLYIDQGLKTVEAIQKKYAPNGAANDPNGLNSNWVGGVNRFWGGFGVNTGSSVFSGWQNKVTSHFGENRGHRDHGGLDIDGNQGDMLEAIAGGKISFIKMDDGGKQDEDGKANSRSGGTEVGVQMADGNTYFYSHLSNVNPNLKVGGNIAAGEWLGDMGGDKGVAGSGYSTTGSHLHLGYMNANGELMNPEDLLNQGSIGDSGIGTMGGGTTKHISEITVKLDLTGAGADQLNKSTQQQLEALVRKVMLENERLKLSINPTRAGYN